MRRIHVIIAGLLWLLLTRPAHAWMTYTHEYLAELAIQEALTRGTVTVYQVDPVHGWRVRAVATFKVDGEVISSIRHYRGEYHAGLIGPDGYPDLITGLYGIHPDNSMGNRCGPTSDEWLQRIWHKSRGPLGTRLAEKAFALGFLQHAAGDMFAHDYLNYYTGGEWSEGHHNAIKHTALEAYVSSVTPASEDPHFYDLSVTHVQQFMIDTLIHTPLLSGDGGRYSLLAWLQALHSAPLTPRYHLHERLEFGLSQWPELSTQLAQATMFNSQRRVDWDAADAAVHSYLKVLDAMVTEDEMATLYQKFKSWLPESERDDLMWFRKARKTEKGISKAILARLTQRRPALKGLQQVLDDVTSVFDGIVGVKDPTATYPDHPITLEQFRRDELHMEPSQAAFDPFRFRPAYNTYVACQLCLLNSNQLGRLATTLRKITKRGPATGTGPENFMLGFLSSMNESHAWRSSGYQEASFLFDRASFRLIFVDQH